jgi:hypothetical protein
VAHDQFFIPKYSRKFKLFRKKKGDRKAKTKPIADFQRMHKWILWLEIFAPSVFSSDKQEADDNVPPDFNTQFYEFLKNTNKR